jgi:hypothetical protein
MYYPTSEYKLTGFVKSNTENKKYDAVLKNKKTGKLTHVPFGDSRYEQYKDSTGLGAYTSKDHGDPNRRKLYKMRHQKDLKPNNYSAGYFSYYYLW